MKVGDIVKILGGSVNNDYIESHGFEVGSLHILIDSFPNMTKRERRSGWLGVKHNGSYFTVTHFTLELIATDVAHKAVEEEYKMHIEPVVRTYNVVLTSKEIQLITYGLTPHAANPGTVTDKVTQCLKMVTAFNNAIKGV